MPDLKLTDVPPRTGIGVEAKVKIANVDKADSADWELSATPADLTISPPSGTGLKAGESVYVAITPTKGGRFNITLSNKTMSGGAAIGSPAETEAFPPAIQSYLDLLEDLETPKF